jgi:hypothetical protein
MGPLFFTKPQPLSPNTKVQLDAKGRRVLIRKGKPVLVKGTWTADSLYYLWFEYLKRSNKYKIACASKGKGMRKIFDDFGDIFQYQGLDGFWQWWNERGQYLFGISPVSQLNDFCSLEELAELETEIAVGNYQLVALPTNLTKSALKNRVGKLISQMNVDPSRNDLAKYQIKHVKVDADSLKNCLLAYDLKQQGLDALEIAFRVKSVTPKEAEDLLIDGRKNPREVDLEGLVEMSEQNHAEYNKRLKRAEEIVSKRLERLGKTWDDVDYDALLDKEMGLLKTNYVRTARKASLRTNTYKLIKKAEANIAAVERGEFGFGH